MASFTLSLSQFPPELMVVCPTKILVPVVLAKTKLPLIVVVPFIVIVVALRVLVVPAVTVRFDPTERIPVLDPLMVEPESVKLVIP